MADCCHSHCEVVAVQGRFWRTSANDTLPSFTSRARPTAIPQVQTCSMSDVKAGSSQDQTVTYSPDRTFEGPLHAKTCPIPKECNSAEAVVRYPTRLRPQWIGYRSRGGDLIERQLSELLTGRIVKDSSDEHDSGLRRQRGNSGGWARASAEKCAGGQQVGRVQGLHCRSRSTQVTSQVRSMTDWRARTAQAGTAIER